MLAIGKKIKKKISDKVSAFSLIEIIVSMAIFAFVITSVVTITIQMAQTQKRIQGKLFLVQSAQTTIESMSRQLRYGYYYSGTDSTLDSNLGNLIINTSSVASTSSPGSTNTQNLQDIKNSPYIIFESQNGNPNSMTDQHAFCVFGGKLYKVNGFTVDSSNANYFRATCSSAASALDMTPDSITIDSISFDILAGDSQSPKNPTVRVKLKMSHEVGGTLELQTTITQRLVSYF